MGKKGKRKSKTKGVQSRALVEWIAEENLRQFAEDSVRHAVEFARERQFQDQLAQRLSSSRAMSKSSDSCFSA